MAVERAGELMLTEKGCRRLIADHRRHGNGEKPSWDGRSRVLRWRGEVIKQLGRAASNQEPDEHGDLKGRLRETVRGLNDRLEPVDLATELRYTASGHG